MKLKDILKNVSNGAKLAYFICLAVSITLIIAGFICPPLAVIDGSVLTAVGEIFGFASLGIGLAAIEKGYSTTIRKGETEISIKDDDEK